MAQTTICIRIDTDVKKRIRNILRLHRHEHVDSNQHLHQEIRRGTTDPLRDYG